MTNYTITEGRRTAHNLTIESAREIGFSDAAIAESIKVNAKRKLLRGIEVYRQRLSGAEAGVDRPGPERIGIWNAKARICREHIADVEAIPAQIKAVLEREATANGRTLESHAQRIVFKADTFEYLGLLIDAMEAEAEYGLDQIDPEDGLTGAYENFLSAAEAQAQTAFNEGLASLAG